MSTFANRRKKTKAELIWASISIFAVIAIAIGIITDNLAISVAVSVIPAIFMALLASFEKPKIAFFLLLVINFAIPVTSHYIYNFSTGLLMDGMLVFLIFVILSQNLTGNISLKRVPVDVILVVGIWLFYCIIEVFNPRMIKFDAWYKTIRNMALYFFLITLMVPIVIEKLEDVKEFLVLWSVFVIIATLKVLYQRYIGFTSGD